jgi:glucose-1-phosphate thymidylyltransferase
MKVIVPVAGIGSRLRPHTYTQPKALLHVVGRPIIDHILEPIVRLDPEEVIFVIGFMGEQVEAHVRKNFRFPCRFVSQDKLLGLGYALNLALEDISSGPLLVVLGDTIVDVDLRSFVSAGKYSLGLRQVDDPKRFGIAEIKEGKIVGLEEKPEHPKSDMAVIGLYYFEDASLLKSLLAEHVRSGRTTRGEIQFTDALEQLIRQGVSFTPFEVREWYDCGKVETLLATNRHLLERTNSSPAPDGSVVIPPVFIAPGARVSRSVIGPHVSISDGAVISESVIRNSIIGEGAVVERAVLEDSLVGRGTTVRDEARVLNVAQSSGSDADR